MLTVLITLVAASYTFLPSASAAFPCPSDNHVPLPKGSKLVLSLTWTRINEEDSGKGNWYWALDHLTNVLKVWQMPNGTWFSNETQSGEFVTPQGALSPNAGTPETESGYGNMKACFAVSFTGTFNSGGGPSRGNLGTKNYGGTTADILLGTNNPHGDYSFFSWQRTYFTNLGVTVYWRDSFRYTLTSDTANPSAVKHLTVIGAFVSPPGAYTGDIIT